MCCEGLKDMSLHILDIALNSVEAGAGVIEITVTETVESYGFLVKDNGCGMDCETLIRAADYGFTTKKSKNGGMGLALLKALANNYGGKFSVTGEKGKGAQVSVDFIKPVIEEGCMAETMLALITGCKADFIYTHIYCEKSFLFNTREIREKTGASFYNNISAAIEARDFIKKSLSEIKQ